MQAHTQARSGLGRIANYKAKPFVMQEKELRRNDPTGFILKR
jgi:hypothetical protein